MSDDQPPRSVTARATPGVRQAFIETRPDGTEKAWLHDENGNWRPEPGLEISPEQQADIAARKAAFEAVKSELPSLLARLAALEAKVNG